MKKSIAILLLFAIAGCAAERVFDDGRKLIEAGEVDQGLAKVEEAAKLAPEDRRYRQYYMLQRDVAAQRNLALAEQAKLQGQWEAAESFYRRVLAFDPASARATAGLESLRAERRRRAWLAEAEEALKKNDLATAHARVRSVLAENGNHREALQLARRIEERSVRSAAAASQLAASLRKPITLEFRDAPIRQVFELISKNAGLNFVLDRDVRPDLRTTLFVRNTSMDDVLRFILVTNQLERKVLNENTLLIYPNTQAKNRDYQELVTKTFYLSNAEAKQTANMIRQLVKTKDLYVDEKLNFVVMRDTPEAVRMAERLVANQDIADPEVMLEVEVLEVGSNVLYELGIRYPDQVAYSLVGAAGTAGTLTLTEWLNRNSGLVRMAVTNPLFVLNLRNQAGSSNLLANPRIRVRNKDKAKVHIGDKVPVITTTSTSTGFIAESVNYLDVGLKLDVEPNISLDDEVGIKVGLEVSSIVREIRSTAGTLSYQVGTRNTTTSLRLKDGETQILAGLISDEDRKTANQVPGLGSIPILGRLFGSHQDTSNRTEVMLLITPRIVRNLARPDFRLEEFASGTEAAAGAPPLVLQSLQLAPASASPSPSDAPATAAPAAVGRLLLAAPRSVVAGGEFTLVLSSEMSFALRSGLVDIAFDPSRLRFVSAESEWELRSEAPETMGRLNLSFTGKPAIKGAGELAKLKFQVIGTAAGAPMLRIEAASLTDTSGKVVAAQLPPPVVLSLTR